MKEKAIETRIKNSILAIIIFFIIALILSPCESEAKLRNFIDDLDYSALSVEEIQQEVVLLYKFAKKAYSNNDLELAKLFFYQILELNPEHPGANKYIEYYIPKKSYQLKTKQLSKQKQSTDIGYKRKEPYKAPKRPIVTKQKEEKIKEELAKRQLKKEVVEDKEPTLKQKEAIAAKEKRQEAMQKRDQERLEKKKRIDEERKAKIAAAEKRRQDKLKEKQLKQIVLEEKKKRKLEIAQRKKYEVEQKKQEVIQKREEERIAREKRLAEKQKSKDIAIAKKRIEKEEKLATLEKEKEMRAKIDHLYDLGKQAYSENDLELAKSFFYQILEIDFDHQGANKYIDYYIPRKYYQINKEQIKEEELADDSEEEQIDLSKKPELPSPAVPLKLEKPKPVKVAEKKIHKTSKTAEKINKQEIVETQEGLLEKIVHEEFALIQEEQRRVVKEEELRKKLQKKQAEKKEGMKRTISSQENVLPLAKLSKEVKKEVVEKAKPKEIKTEVVDRQKENLQKYLLWQKKIAALRNKTKNSSAETPSVETPSVKTPIIEQPKQEEAEKVVQKEEVSRKEEAYKTLNEPEVFPRDGEWGKIKSLYKDGVYSYRAGEYDSAQESFEKILQQN